MMTLNKAIRVDKAIPQQADDKKNKSRPEKYKGREILFFRPFFGDLDRHRVVPRMTCLKKNFVILNAVKDLLFAMLLRPVQSANRSFIVVQDDKPFKILPPASIPLLHQFLSVSVITRH
jgi:hypothetical protein